MKNAEVFKLHPLRDGHFACLAPFQRPRIPAKLLGRGSVWCKIVIDPTHSVTDADLEIGRLKNKTLDADLVRDRPRQSVSQWQ